MPANIRDEAPFSSSQPVANNCLVFARSGGRRGRTRLDPNYRANHELALPRLLGGRGTFGRGGERCLGARRNLHFQQ
jgi:hypothetical protein